MNDNTSRLRDIVILLLFAVLLRLVETIDRDVPGWWLDADGQYEMLRHMSGGDPAKVYEAERAARETHPELWEGMYANEG